MAKKKRRRHPKAPPVHSAPQSAPAPQQAPHGPTSPEHADQPGAPDVASRPEPPRRPRTAPRSRREARRRRLRNRYIAVGVVVAIGLIGALVGREVVNRRAMSAHATLAAAAGCDDVRSFGGLSREHTAEAVDYQTSPPVGGAHSAGTVPAGVYQEPFSTTPGASPNIYQAVHSLEHGYVVIWHDGLSDDERAALERELRAERKVILVPSPDLEDGTKMALTAWGRLQACAEPSTEVASSFVDLFREAVAPEPDAP